MSFAVTARWRVRPFKRRAESRDERAKRDYCSWKVGSGAGWGALTCVVEAEALQRRSRDFAMSGFLE